MIRLSIGIPLLLLHLSSFAQEGRITSDYLDMIQKEGLTYYKLRKGEKKQRYLDPHQIPSTCEIRYDGEYVQLLLIGIDSRDYVHNGGQSGMLIENHVSMLFAKRIDEDYFTYVGYAPAQNHQVLVVPFKKQAAMYLKDYPKLKKQSKDYKKYDAVAVFQEYDAWVSR